MKKQKIKRILRLAVFVVMLLLLLLDTCHGLETIKTDVDKECESVMEKADGLINELNISNITESFFLMLSKSVKDCAGVFAPLLFVTLIAGITNAFIDNRAVMKASEIIVCASAFSVISSICNNVGEMLNAIESFILSMLPLMTAMYTACSAPITAASSYASTIVALNLCSASFTKIFIPCVKCITVFSTVTLISGVFDFSGISRLLKGTVMRLFGLVLCIMSACIYFQSIISGAKDSIASRAIRYAASSVIPVIGGVVSESARTVSESLKLTRSVSGISGIIVIIGAVSAPLIAVAVSKFFFQLCACVARLIGGVKTGAYYDDLCEVLNMLLASCIGVCLVFILILGIFAKITITV